MNFRRKFICIKLLLSICRTVAELQSNEVAFLLKFGYLIPPTHQDEASAADGPPIAAASMQSAAAVGDALAQMQRVARIPITGRLDAETRRALSRPRCGMPDTELLRALSLHHYNSYWSSRRTRMRRCSRCTLHPNHLRKHRRRRFVVAPSRVLYKWNKTSITYSIENVARRIADMGTLRRVIHDAVELWNGASTLRIHEVAPQAAGGSPADIRISFRHGSHGDAYPFDGPGLVLAHAFYPPPLSRHRSTDTVGRRRERSNVAATATPNNVARTGGGGRHLLTSPSAENSGDIHFDDDEPWQWRWKSDNSEVNLEAVAAHEIGHSLGLYHSDHPLSIMYPYYRFDEIGRRDGAVHERRRRFELHEYDRILLQRLYGADPNESEIRPKTTSPTLTTPKPPITASSTMSDGAAKRPSLAAADAPDPCSTTVDAASMIRQEIFMFRGKWLWRFDDDGALKEQPSLIINFWQELGRFVDANNGEVDALFEWSDRLYFFVGRQVLEYSERRIVSARNLTDIGLPADVERIRLAYNWHYGLDPKYYVWTDHLYWKIDVTRMKTELDYPRRIADNWRDVPEGISAAFSWKKQLYFVGDSELYKFSSLKMSVSRNYPKPFGHVLKHCMPRAEE